MGEEGRINITEQLTSYNISEETGSASVLDAEIEVGGVSYQRASNSIDDIISGTTINLQSTGETTLSVVADKQSVKDEIKSFVTNLKDIISEINKHSSYDVEAEEQGALYDVTSIRSFKSQLVNDVMRPYEGSGDITSMVDLGLEYTRDGGITLDEDVLNNAVETNFEAVKEFMLGNSENETEGWADSVNERLRSATSSVDGIVKLERNSAKDTLDRLAKQITNDQQRLDKKYDIMAKQFAQLDSYMNEMNSMSSYLTQHFNALDSSKDN
jgi:flagellar hook-associated protein 2